MKTSLGVVGCGSILYLLSCVLPDSISQAVMDCRHHWLNWADLGTLAGVPILVVLYFAISEMLPLHGRMITGILLPLCLLWVCVGSMGV
jgi:hypothetical protein